MKRYARISALTLAVIAVLGCNSRTDKTDDGGIILSITNFSGLPSSMSASAAYSNGQATIGSISVQSIVKNPGQGSSALMNVEMESYEVTFRRDDFGSQVPPKLTNHIFGSVAPGGVFTVTNGPFMRIDQLNNEPLKTFIKDGIDHETGSTVMRFIVSIQFFGRTISGDVVQSAPAQFTLEVLP
jgi:hypothetical protein